MRPTGALQSNADLRGNTKVYVVYSLTHPSPGRIGDVVPVHHVDRIVEYLPEWFDGQYGYFFTNYFHALAYALKQKAEAEAVHKW